MKISRHREINNEYSQYHGVVSGTGRIQIRVIAESTVLMTTMLNWALLLFFGPNQIIWKMGLKKLIFVYHLNFRYTINDVDY